MADLLSVAIHEAAHAVVSAELAECRGADVIRTDKRLGVCRHTTPENKIHHMAIALAGQFGEYLHGGRRGPMVDRFLRTADLDSVDRELMSIYGYKVRRESTPEFRLALKLAVQFLCEHWGAVVRSQID